MAEFTEFNQNNIEDVRSKIDEAIALLKEVGLDASISHLRGGKNELRTKLTIVPINPNAPKIAKIGVAKIVPHGMSDRAYELNVGQDTDYGFFIENRGKTVTLSDGSGGVLIEYKSRNPKNKFIVENASGKYRVPRKMIIKVF